MLGSVQRIIRKADAATANAYLSLFRERNAVMGFLFHSLFADDREASGNLIHPLQRTTVEQFRRFVEYYRAQEYRFITPADLLAGLAPDGKYVLITFDDGYFNNTRALPILEELKVPATFFITTENVLRQKCFWWDVHWRKSAARDERRIDQTRWSVAQIHDHRADRRGIDSPFRRRCVCPARRPRSIPYPP